MKRLVWMLLFVSCTARETPAPPRDPEPPRITRIASAPQIAINATFRPRRTVYLINCNDAIITGLQRLENGRWVHAFAAPTNACFSQPIVLQPGQSRTERVVVTEPMPAGTYRVVFYNVLTTFNPNARTGEPHGDELPIDERASVPFIIEGEPQ